MASINLLNIDAPNINLLRSLEWRYARAKGRLTELDEPPKAHHVRLRRHRDRRELETEEREALKQELRQYLAAIEVVARWDLPEWDPSQVKSVKSIRRYQTTGHGGLSGTTKDLLRDSGGEHLTVREWTRMACERLGLDWSGENRERYRVTVYGTLERLAKSGLIKSDGAKRDRRYWLSDEDDD